MRLKRETQGAFKTRNAGCVLRFKRKRKITNAKIYVDKRDLYYIYRNAILPVLYTILNVFSDGELSDSEWLNLTQLTVDGHVNIIVDNTEHCHDSGIH